MKPRSIPAGHDVITDGWGKKAIFPPLPKRPVPLITEVTKEDVANYAVPVKLPVAAKKVGRPKKGRIVHAPRREGFKKPDIKIAHCPLCGRYYGYVPVTDEEKEASKDNHVCKRVCEKHGDIK